MKKYKVTASQTIYATYEIEVDAKNKQQAEKIALATSVNDWDEERFENYDALSIDEIEEVRECHNAMTDTTIEIVRTRQKHTSEKKSLLFGGQRQLKA